MQWHEKDRLNKMSHFPESSLLFVSANPCWYPEQYSSLLAWGSMSLLQSTSSGLIVVEAGELLCTNLASATPTSIEVKSSSYLPIISVIML